MTLKSNAVRILLRCSALAMLATAPGAARAEFLPNPQSVAGPEERAVLRVLADLMLEQPRPDASALARLDPLLAQLGRPTPLRGMVQYFRGAVLAQADRDPEAEDAIQESVRLLPGYSGPLLLASRFEAYRDRGPEAAAYLLRASRIDPEIVRRIPDYELSNLIGRLRPDRASAVRRQVIERMFEIGWRGQRMALRSLLARELIGARLDDGHVEQAAILIPQIASPTDAYALLTQKRFEPLWARIEEWAGSRQERLWRVYLREMRDQWRASGDQELAGEYVEALGIAGRHNDIVTEFLPLFSNLDREDDYHLLWLAGPLGTSLARLGRWDEAEQMFARGLQVWPVGSEANALNLLANRGRQHYLRGDSSGAVRDLAAAIADGNRRGGEVATGSLYGMHYYLACALEDLGRGGEAIGSIAFVQGNAPPTVIANLHLCFGRQDAARAVLLEGLENEDWRGGVIQYLQMENAPPLPSELRRGISARKQALREDPQLLGAIARYGRILPYPIGAGAVAAKGDDPGT